MKEPNLQAWRIFAVCTVGNEDADLLPHWLEHYAELGVDRILLKVTEATMRETEEIIDRCARQWNFERYAPTEADAQALLELAGATTGDWVLWAEIFELHQFPGPPREIIKRATAKGIDGVFAWGLDRAAADGSLPNIRRQPSLIEQFPVTCRLSERVFGKSEPKAILSRFRGEPRPGVPPLGRADQYVTHRFLWHGDAVIRLQKLLAEPGTEAGIKKAIDELLRQLSDNSGRIDLMNPALQACGGPIGPAGTGGSVPYIGDRVMLLHCDEEIREALRERGLAGDCTVGRDGVDVFLKQLVRSRPGDWIAALEPWIGRIRNEAAIAGGTATVWMPEIPKDVAAAVRQIAGEELLEISAATVDEAVGQLQQAARPAAQGPEEVFAVCTIRDGSVDLLPHWLAHYTSMGADRLVVAVVEPIEPHYEATIGWCAKTWEFERYSGTPEMAQDAAGDELHRTALRQAGARPRDWVLHTDLDELHEFPAPLRAIIAAAEKRGIDTIAGQVVDRVAADGSLAQVHAEPALWEQFPVGCQINKNIALGNTRKIMLARFGAHTAGGHRAVTNAAAEPAVFGRADQYIIHHFKWHGEMISRLRWAMGQPGVCAKRISEARRVIEWIDSRHGMIPVEDPALEATERWTPPTKEARAIEPALGLPWIGDKVVLLQCEVGVWSSLRQMGMVGNESTLVSKLPSGDGVGHQQLTMALSPWLNEQRNAAMMNESICAVWKSNLPEAIENALRHVAGEDLVEIAAGDLAEAMARLGALARHDLGQGQVVVAGAVQAEHADLLPHWLEHYTKLGVDRIVLAFYPQGNLPELIEGLAARFSFEALALRGPMAPGSEEEENRRTLLRRAGVGPRTWVIHANVDELHEYPAAPRKIAAAAEARHIGAVFGEVLDRVAADGTLPPMRAEPGIWEQFPMGCRISATLGGGIARRMMMARFSSPGNAEDSLTPVGRPENYVVHQFCWHDEAIARMQTPGTERIVAWLGANSGKVNLGDPALKTHEEWHPSRLLSAEREDPAEARRIPYVGDRVLLLDCPRQVFRELRRLGLHGGFGPGSGEAPTGAAPAGWVNRLRNEAAMAGGVATVWAAGKELANSIRRQAGSAVIEVAAQNAAEAVTRLETMAAARPATTGQVWAAAVVRAESVKLLPHWLAHYKALGVDRTILIRTDKSDGEIDRVLNDCTTSFGFDVVWEAAGCDAELVRSALRQAGAEPGTWVVHASLEEFHEFPAPLAAVLAAAKAREAKAVFGELLDRAAADGSLAAVAASPSIWEQFPVGCQLTKKVAKRRTERAMAARFEVPVELAQAASTTGGIGAAPIGNPHGYVVHYFNWHGELPRRLQSGLSEPYRDAAWKHSAQQVLAWLRINHGGVGLGNPFVEARVVPPSLAA